MKKAYKYGHIGELQGISDRLARKVVEACEYTRRNQRLILNVAFNYGGRDEIVHAVQDIVRAGIPAEDISEATINNYMIHQRPARSGSDYPHEWRIAPEQLSHLAGRIQRNLYHRNLLAGLRA